MNKNFNWNEFKEEKIAIEVSNEKECKEFLKECEKNNIKWGYDRKATDFIPPLSVPASIVYNFFYDYNLGYSRSGFFKENGYKIIKWSDAKNCNSREEIIVYRSGNEVIALHKENGETVKSAKSKCNPEDEFNFNVGVKLAFERLMNDNTKDDLPDFKVREFVKVICGITHYFPIGSVIEIKKVYKESKELICYGYTNCCGLGLSGFNEQRVKFGDVKKISN